MSNIPINTLLAEFTPYEASELLLGETGLSDIPKTLLAGTFGLAIQALVTGSVLQLVHRYFIRQKRSFLRTGIQDPPLARVGVVWLTALICLHVVVVNVINTRVVLMSQQFTAGYLMDFWLAQISNLIFAIVLLPVFLFFAFRAWNLWSRSKVVLALCLIAVLPAVGFGVTAAALGLQHPYPLQEIDNSAFAAWLPFFTMTMKKLQWVALASSISQYAAACVFSGLICAGLWHHRACCAIMPGFTGKIAFACGESLFPLVVTSGAILAGDVLTNKTPYSVGPLISRAVHSCAPAIYFHCLMNSLTSAQRQRDALRSAAAHASSEEADTGLPGSKEKADPYAEDDEGSDTFNPRYHPEDLDTPLQVEINHPGAGKGLPKIITTACSSGSSTPGLMAKRPSFSIRSPFSFTRTRKNSIPDPEAELRSVGTGRRSSLAFAAQAPPSPGSLSIKLQNKLPIVSFKPGMDRRQSESIFVAHEEFEGLPTTPGDVDVGGMRLGDIDEAASDAAVTPKYFTPPRVPSPMPSPAAVQVPEQMEWRGGEELKSPESVYEAEVGKA